MISEFIWLDLTEQSEHSLCCSCSLPDPDPYTDDSMVICGYIGYQEISNTGSATINIRLFDNFEDLCVGDIYQRKDFVQTILFVLQGNYGIDFQEIRIVLSDCWGEYSGDLSGLDEITRGVDS